jgi:DNA-directed RNA polymerase subunit F
MDRNYILDLDLFTSVNDDLEKRQLHLLAGMKKVQKVFRDNRIYPELSELIRLRRILNDILTRIEDVYSDLPKRIKKIDLINKSIEHEVVLSDGANIEHVQEFIQWSLPHIQKVIEEGIAIYEYVEEQIEMEEVGILPQYRDEGYFFVPNNIREALCLYQYEVSIFKSAQDRYRSLKTSYMKQLRWTAIKKTPNRIKVDLIKERKDLPNPATYLFDTELEFPFRETILPIVKRKLMRHLA